MKGHIPFLVLTAAEIPIWLYGAVNQRRMRRERHPPGFRLNPYATAGLTAKGFVYRRRSLNAILVMVLLRVQAVLVGLGE